MKIIFENDKGHAVRDVACEVVRGRIVLVMAGPGVKIDATADTKKMTARSWENLAAMFATLTGYARDAAAKKRVGSRKKRAR